MQYKYMVVVIDLELGNRFRPMCLRKYGYNMLLAIFFIFQASPENHSKALNNLRNIFPPAAFGEPIIRHYTWMHILICNKLQ